MKGIIRFIFDVFLFGFIFISVLYYLDALNEQLKLNEGIVFFIDTLIICYVFYRHELSFLESGVPKYKNPPEPPKGNIKPRPLKSRKECPPPPPVRTIKGSSKNRRQKNI